MPGIAVGEKPLLPADLLAADEVFITSTTRDLLPVVEIEGTKVGRTLATQTARSGRVFRMWAHRMDSRNPRPRPRVQPAAPGPRRANEYGPEGAPRGRCVIVTHQPSTVSHPFTHRARGILRSKGVKAFDTRPSDC